jgi:hypothetical protein
MAKSKKVYEERICLMRKDMPIAAHCAGIFLGKDHARRRYVIGLLLLQLLRKEYSSRFLLVESRISISIAL